GACSNPGAPHPRKDSMRKQSARISLLGLVVTVALLVALTMLSPTSRSYAAPGPFPSAAALRQLLVAAVNTGGDAGGLFHGTRMWGAIVNRNGELVVVTTSTADPTQVWPASQAIAKAKAYTANSLS